MPTFDWFTGLEEVSARVMSILPSLLGAALLVLIGWLAGRLTAWGARRLTEAMLNRVGRLPSVGNAIESAGIASYLPRVIGQFAFWLLLLFFVAAALETLGLPVATASLSRLAYYLPNVLAAVLAVIAGLVVGRLLGNVVTRTASGSGMAFGREIGLTVRGTVILVAAVVAIEQVGLKADVLIVVVAVVVGASLVGAGLAFGLGARTAVSNIIASYYAAQAYQVGQVVRVSGIEGKIVQMTPTSVFIATKEGRVLIPARTFGESASTLVTETNP